MMYISALPWIFNIILVGTIILLAGEIIVARKDEREAYNRMLEFFGESDHGRKKKPRESRVARGVRPGKTLRHTGEHSSSVTIEELEKREETTDFNNMIALTNSIKRWVKIRGIDKAHPNAQFVKVAEEFGEIAEGLAKKDKRLTIDGIGNTYVALVALCGALDLEIDECIYHAYKKIDDSKAKKVKMVDGFFGKERES